MPNKKGSLKMKNLFIILSISFFLYNCERERNTSPPKDSSIFPATQALSIYVDSADVVWVGSEAGLCSFNGEEWKLHNAVEGIPAGSIRGIAFQKTNYGDEIWLASNEGAGVAAFELDAVTGATTYTIDNSEILNDTVIAVSVDAINARWFSTPDGVNIYLGSTWYKEKNFGFLVDHPAISFGVLSDGWVLAGTNGAGVARHKYNEAVDGITGASYYDTDWSLIPSDTVLAICVDENNYQWFGTPQGVAFHESFETKEGWTVYDTKDGLIDKHVKSIVKDKKGVVWFGTPTGLSSFDGAVWNSFTTADGLVNDCIYALDTDSKDDLWVATRGGVSKFDGTNWTNYRSE